MELKVWVEGIQRIVCGVTEGTTCQDVVFALAHATGKVGRFTLIERWRTNERLLAPQENPLKILMKWGEYSSDVQFILQRSDRDKNDQIKQTNQQQIVTTSSADFPAQKSPPEPATLLTTNEPSKSTSTTPTPTVSLNALDRSKEARKSFGNSPIDQNKHHGDNVGIVKGIPQRSPLDIQYQQHSQRDSPASLNQQLEAQHSSSPSPLPLNQIVTTNMSTSNHSVEFNSADVRNSLDRKTKLQTPPTAQPSNLFREARNLSNENLLEAYNLRVANELLFSKNGPPISSNGALVPPPYRDPPPPRSSPSTTTSNSSAVSGNNATASVTINNNNSSQQKSSTNHQHQKSDSFSKNFNDYTKDSMNLLIKDLSIELLAGNDCNNLTIQNTQYRDLIQLIKYQRDKINSQQADLTKYDAEIIFLENKERDQIQQIESISREISKTDLLLRQGSEQLQSLQYVEDEHELVRQQEKTLKSEISLLRSKLSNCETELLQCKNKIRLIMDDIQIEQRSLHHNRQNDRRSTLVDRHFLTEMERIQAEIDQAVQNAETSNKTMDNLKKEVSIIEIAIAEKKKQVEQLVNEMKEVNLQSLAITPSEEIRTFLEGSNRPGSTRRIIGSPRQLENAVPTSKNPHGVWV